LLKGFGDNSVDLELRFWVNDTMNGYANVKSEVLHKVWQKFGKSFMRMISRYLILNVTCALQIVEI